MNTPSPQRQRACRFACMSIVLFLIAVNISTYVHQEEDTAFAQQQRQQTSEHILNDVWNKASHQLMGTPWAGAQGTSQSMTFILNDVWDKDQHLLRVSGGSGGGSGPITDANIPDLNTLSTGLTPSRCVQTDATGKLSVTAGPCSTGTGTGAVTISGTPLAGQPAVWTDADTLQGVSTSILANIVCDDSTPQSAALQTIINNAPVGSKIVLPAGACRMNSSLTINKYLTLEGAGLDQTFLKQSVTNIPVLTVTSINVNITDMTIMHTGTPVTGGDGLIVRAPDGASLQSVNVYRVSASWNYRGFVLGCMAYAQMAHVMAAHNNSHGFEFLYENTPGCGVDQYDILHANATLNKGVGFYGNNTAYAQGLGPWLTQTLSFANDLGGYIFQGSPGHPINDLRLHNTLSSFDNVAGIFLDTYGGSHMISEPWIEYTGLSTGFPLGTDNGTSAPSNTGHCLSITQNNGTVTVVGGLYWNCAWSGVALYAPFASMTGGSSLGNGQALDSDPARRAGIALGGNNTQVSGHTFTFPGTTTLEYIHIAAGVTNPIIGFNSYDPALAAEVMRGVSNLNLLDTGLTANRCVQTDGTGKLSVASGVCTAGGGISDGDKGDVTVSASGATWTIDSSAVTYAKIQNVSATARLLGRNTAGAGVVEELTPAIVKTMLGVTFGDITGTASDAQVPDLNTLSTGLTISRCVETDGTGKLGVAAGACGVSGGSTGISGATNHGMLVATGGTTASSLAVATNGQLPIGSTGADPVLGTLTGTANQIQVSTGPGVIQLAIPTNPTLPGTTTGTFSGPLAGTATTATALAVNGTDCAAGFAPLGVDASGNAEGCVDIATQAELTTHTADQSSAHGATSLNTANRIVRRDGAGQFAATTVTAPNLVGNATTATALAANGTNCSAGQAPLGVDASGNAEGCFTPAGGSGAFSAITSGTNTTAAMVVGSGASLGASGTGAIAATTADALTTDPTACTSGSFVTDMAADGSLICATPATVTWPALTSGTNTIADLLLGSGASLRTTGTGVIDATSSRFVIPLFTTPTVTANAITPDLNVAEVFILDTIAANLTINNPTGSSGRPYNEQSVEFRFKSASPVTLTFGAKYTAENGIPLPTATTGDGSTTDRFKFKYNSVTTNYGLVATTTGAGRGMTILPTSTDFLCNASTSDKCRMQMTSGSSGSVTMKNPTAPPPDGAKLQYNIQCTVVQNIIWESKYVSSAALPLPTTGACPADTNRYVMYGFEYIQATDRYQLIASTN